MVSLTPLGVQFNYLLHYMNFSNLKLITRIWLSVPKIQDVVLFLMAYLTSVFLAMCPEGLNNQTYQFLLRSGASLTSYM